jgi:regulator of sirC expression with transglutaminase-like and TPR domain
MTETPTESEVNALIRLLDDPDTDVQESVQRRLDELGREALPLLLDAQASTEEPLRSQLDDLVHDLHMRDIVQAWTAIMEQDNPDLERGAFLLALYRFPRLDIPKYRDQLDAFAEEIRPQIEAEDGAKRAMTLASFLCDELGFQGNDDHYYDPNNSYLNQVIDRRLGIPISLSVLYVLIGRRCKLPVYGVNMPAHFLVKYIDRDGELFIDLFNGGSYVTKEECIRFLLKAGVQPHSAYFSAADAQDILLRMGRNLLAIANDNGQEQMVEDLSLLLEPWDPSLQ